MYDFDRRDKNGNLRELHTELALDAIDYERKNDFKLQYNRTENQVNNVAKCPYFITNYLKLNGDFKKNLAADDSFHIYMCVKGSAVLSDGSTEVSIAQGETVLFPACLEQLVVKSNGVELLEVYI